MENKTESGIMDCTAFCFKHNSASWIKLIIVWLNFYMNLAINDFLNNFIRKLLIITNKFSYEIISYK